MVSTMDDQFEQWKEQLQRTHGPQAYFSKKVLAKQWLALKQKHVQPSQESANPPAFMPTALTEGSTTAKLIFLAESTGPAEELKTTPFSGKVDELFKKIISAMGLTLNDVYIANIIKGDPSSNLEPFLFRTIETMQPKVIVVLGETSLPLYKQRGQFVNYQGTKLISTFHPSYLLQHPEAKKEVWEDMKKVMAQL